ncbi:MAG: hypothetical protein EOM36_02055 [Bacteroidia bacterium]|nr:hypothetical protein [Bacteroidia bacterium]
MKAIFQFVFILLFSLVLGSCGETLGEITDPGETDNPRGDGPKENVKVGKQGGEIVKDKLTIKVPAGAFAADVTLEISKQAAGTVMQDYEASAYYKIKVPQDFSKPLTVQLPATKAITSGDVFVRFAVSGFQVSTQQESQTACWVKAKKEGDVYVADLQPGGEPASEAVELTVGLVKDYQASEGLETRAATPGPACVVIAPAKYSSHSEKLKGWATDAVNKLKAIGFSFDKRKSPIQIEVKEINREDNYGYFVASWWNSEYNSIQLNAQQLEKTAEMKRAMMHEMTHFTQYYYDPRPTFAKGTSSGDFLWMDEAVAVWAEKLYVEGISSVQQGNQFCPVDGFFPLEGEEIPSHGYGMAGLIQWLAEKYGDNKIVSLHEKQFSKAASVYEAFSQAFPDLFTGYGTFLKDYVEKGGVKDLLPGVTRAKLYVADMNEVSSPTNQPLGGNRYSAFIERIGIDPEMKLPSNGVTMSISVTGGESDGTGQSCGLFRYSSDTKKVSKLADFHDSYGFSDVVNLKDKKDQLYVVYYHPYNKVSQVKMTVKLEDRPDFNVGMLKMEVAGLVNVGKTFAACIPDELYFQFKDMKGKTTSAGTRLTYTSSLTRKGVEYGYDAEHEWMLTLEIDTKTNKIISGSAKEVKTNFYKGKPPTLRSRYTTSVEFRDIPFQKISSGRHTFVATKADGKMDHYVTTFSYKTEENPYGTIQTKVYDSWNSNTDFSITIQLDNL